MKKHVLIAGGAGFLGSHLCERFFAEGYRVTAIDNLLTGSKKNLSSLIDQADFTFIPADAEATTSIQDKFDLVLHFASPASPPIYMAHPIATLHAGSNVTEALLEVAKRDGARFVLASTSEVYGDPLEHPQSEGYWGNVNPIGPRSVYDEAKRYAEALTAAYRRSFQVNTGIVRIFNTYGPRMNIHDGRAVPAFIDACLSDTELELHGDGSQTRSLCYVDDLVAGIFLMSQSDFSGPVNLGNDHEQSLRSIAEMIIELSGSVSQIVLHPRPVDDPERRQPNIELAKKELNWEPRIPVGTGLANTVDWFKSQSDRQKKL